MLRNILIGLGFFVAILPYSGFPHSWYAVLSSMSGLAIVFLLLFARRRAFRSPEILLHQSTDMTESPQPLSIQREVEERHDVYVDRNVMVDVGRGEEISTTELVVEKKITTSRRSRKKVEHEGAQSEATL